MVGEKVEYGSGIVVVNYHYNATIKKKTLHELPII